MTRLRPLISGVFNFMNEIWKDIPNYEGLYQASNLGRVRSLPKAWISGNGGIQSHNGMILKMGVNSAGYGSVVLAKETKRTSFKVHKLIAMAFLNHTPCGMKLVVDHINNNKLDNRVENLQITTNRHNASKDKKNKTSKYTGVYKQGNYWISQIRINNNKYHLGSFKTEYEAHLCYEQKVREIETNA